MGLFWPLDETAGKLEQDPQRGYVQLGVDGVVNLETLDENPFKGNSVFDGHVSSPSAVFGITTKFSVLLLNVASAGFTSVVGGGKASVRRYRSYSIIQGIDPQNLRSTKLKAVEVFFPGIERWSEVQISEEEWDRYEDGRLRGFTIRVKSAPEQTVLLGDGRKISLSAHWSVKGEHAKRQIFSPVSISCKSVESVDAWELIELVLRLQELISLAFDGFVVAEGGKVDLDEIEIPLKRPSLWNYYLMITPPRVRVPKSLNSTPMFWLRNIGGIEGIRRWIILSHEHPRVVKPVVNHFRLGAPSPELRLMETAAGMEYWRAINRHQDAEWAATQPPSRAIAEHVGACFSDWVGDSGKWADQFWQRYNQLKHEPSFAVDESEISLLANVGLRLLIAELLVYIADDVSPPVAGQYLKNYRLDGLGEVAKGAFGTAQGTT